MPRVESAARESGLKESSMRLIEDCATPSAANKSNHAGRAIKAGFVMMMMISSESIESICFLTETQGQTQIFLGCRKFGSDLEFPSTDTTHFVYNPSPPPVRGRGPTGFGLVAVLRRGRRADGGRPTEPLNRPSGHGIHSCDPAEVRYSTVQI